MIDHPCFHCSLPDCDDTDARCEIRRLNSRYRKKQRRRRFGEISDLERIARSIITSDHRRERKAISDEKAGR